MTPADPNTLVDLIPDMLRQMEADSSFQAWEQIQGEETTRLTRCICLAHIFALHGVDTVVQCAIPRKSLPTMGSVPGPSGSWAYALRVPALGVCIGPNGERGEGQIVASIAPGYHIRPDKWVDVAQEKLDYELGFMDLSERLPPVLALLQARLLDRQSPASQATHSRPRI